MTSAEVNRAPIGVVRKPHGVRGGLKVTLYSIDLDMLQDLEQLFVKSGDSWQTLTLKSVQGYDDFAILSFHEIRDRTEAEMYRECQIFTLREALPELDADEFYINDLIGCEVIDDHARTVGVVTEVLTPGAHEVLVVQGAEETLIPLVADWVQEIDLEHRTIHVLSAEDVI